MPPLIKGYLSIKQFELGFDFLTLRVASLTQHINNGSLIGPYQQKWTGGMVKCISLFLYLPSPFIALRRTSASLSASKFATGLTVGWPTCCHVITIIRRQLMLAVLSIRLSKATTTTCILKPCSNVYKQYTLTNSFLPILICKQVWTGNSYLPHSHSLMPFVQLPAMNIKKWTEK